MIRIRERIKFTAGWAEANLGPRSHVRVGDRLVPKAIDVDFPGVDGQPALRMALAVVDGRPQCRRLTIEATEDGFVVQGTGGLQGGTIGSHGDHRLAMLGAVAGLASGDGVTVVGMEAAAVSYPGFMNDIASLVR